MADIDIPSSSEPSIDEHPISETCKKAKMADTTTGEDIISGLPDAILCDILSYIPTKYAVATSVLSKRWSHVWTSVPNLDFSDWLRYPRNTSVNEPHFINFVDRVLSLNSVPIVRKIYLHCSEECDFSRVNSWFSAIITRDTEEFSLKLPWSCLIENLDQSSRIYSPPNSFFTRENLVELTLENIALKVPTSVYFPSLKTICLYSVQLLDDVSMKNLISGCPVLWSLRIDRRAWNNTQTLYICSSTLHKLKLITNYCNKDFGYKVVIDAPNLICLYLIDEVDADYNIINLSSLVEIYVGVELEHQGRVQTDEEVFNVGLFELLRKISHVKDLCFATGTMRSFKYALLENMPMFNNVTRMKVELVYDGWSILPYLFHCAPNLASFVLEKDDVHPDCGWYHPNDVPQCFLSSLKNVEIENFEDCEDEMEIIYYFLKNAMVLERLLITSWDLELEKETNILKNLLILPRSSSICQVQYSNSRWEWDE